MKLLKTGKSPTLKDIRGVFAAEYIKKGERIDSCDLILIPASELKFIEKTVLNNYIYDWTNEYYCLVANRLTLINHSFSPNVEYRRDFKNKRMNYFAVKDIKKGEELLINYNGEPDDKTPIDTYLVDYKR